MKIPCLEEAKSFLAEAESLNPGTWVQHSIFVAQAAQAIASYHPNPNLDPDKAFILGYLHDIGRREGVTDMRHVIDGYSFLQSEGYDDAARICLTHSFPIKDVHSVAGKWDCTAGELQFVKDYIDRIELTTYDRLIQLCDALALPSGFTVMEKRLVDVVLRHGTNDYTVLRWKAYLATQEEFEKAIGRSVYSVLPGVVENTFGFNLYEMAGNQPQGLRPGSPEVPFAR